jgi:hypothetical protein
MRIVLIIPVIFLILFTELKAQYDFSTLDRKTYDYFSNGDYRNLKQTSDTMISLGMDHYYLRVRLGITEFNKQFYPGAVKNLGKAIKFNSLDTISAECIYNSYLYSGREADAMLYLKSIPEDKRNRSLKASYVLSSSEFFIGSFGSLYDVVTYQQNNLNYEALNNSFGINAGVETYFLNRFSGTFIYTNFHKSGTKFSPVITTGESLNFIQHQFYSKISGYLFPGWEFTGFGHIAFYSESVTLGMPGNRIKINQTTNEYLGGIGLSKNLWKIRAGANISFSNFSNSRQLRGEGYFTWLPSGNLNLYLTSGWMGQNDINWGGTYQISQEIGLKIFKSLWLESGLVKGNSFLYARNFGSMINNSFQIPAITIYTNLIVLAVKHLKFSIMPFYSENNIYSWNLTTYTRANKLNINSFGGLIKLTYKYR